MKIDQPAASLCELAGRTLGIRSALLGTLGESLTFGSSFGNRCTLLIGTSQSLSQLCFEMASLSLQIIDISNRSRQLSPR